MSPQVLIALLVVLILLTLSATPLVRGPVRCRSFPPRLRSIIQPRFYLKVFEKKETPVRIQSRASD